MNVSRRIPFILRAFLLGLLVCLGASGLRAQTPLFQVAPRPTEVQTGATVGVGAVVTGSAAASYVWKKAGVVVGSGSAVAANDWKSVAAGASHTLALKNDGSLWGWGNNQNWQLALASVAAGNPRRSAPTRIGSAADWMGVFASGDRSCAIKKDGTAWYWGGTATSPEMKKVAGDQFWESAAFGGTGAMYLVSLGGVYAFQPSMGSAPSPIGTARDWASVSAWGEMVVALKRDGTLWGYNAMGAGMAQSSPEGGFYMVQSGRWKGACAGPGYAVALREDGTLWAWQRMGGGGGWGLFNNGWQTQYTPRRLGSRSDWKSLAADVLPLAVDGEGRVHQVAESWSWKVGEIPVACRSVVGRSVDSSKWNNEGLALGVDGTLWAWGGNDYGQLGDVQDTTSAAGMVRYDAVQVGVHQDWGLSSPVLGAPLGLVLPNFQMANLGVYELLVNNVAAGSVALAQWTSQPETRRFTAGGLLQLAAGGSLGAGTAPTYQWYRNGVALSGATSPSYSVTNAQTSASGVYWLEMKRGGVAARSESASVVVEESALAGVHSLLAAGSHAAASSALGTMLQATPSHPAANVLKAFTDVYLLIQDSRTTLMLNQLGFTGSADPFNFTLQHAGFPAGGALTSEARNWMKDILYPKLKEAEVRLGNVTSTGFIAALVASDFGSTSTETIPFDYGDVQVARAGLNLVMSLLKWVETQNTDVGLLALKDKRNTGGLSLESLLAMYPNLLNASATATEAQTEFVDRFGKAISYYLNFSAFANPAAGSTGARRLDAEQALFTLTTDDDREGERRLRLNCERLQASIAATSAGAGLQSFSLPTTGFEGTLAVQASPWVFFKHSPGWRNELPAFKANAYVPGTFRADTAIAFYPALKLEEIGRLEAELAAAEPGLTEWFKTGRETVPPNVQLLSLNSGSASVTLQNGASLATNGWLTVSGTVADVTGVGRVLVTRTSGVDVASAVARVVERAPATGAAARVYDWTAQLPAVVGAGTIAASAWDFSGNVTTTSAAVTLSAAAAAVLPVVPERAREIVAGGAGAMAVVVPTAGTLQFTWRRNGASLQAGTASAVDDWASVSIGGYHTAAIKQDGTLWTWGSNSDGQLGAGTARQFPQRVGNGSNWASVSCGRSYTVALTRSGSLWVSGRSPFGTFEQLTALTGSTATSQPWARVSASDNHALVLTRGGRLFGWSDGTGTPVDSGSEWAEMAAGLGRGARMNFAIKRDGTLWAWGDNANGHLGLGWGYYGTVSSPAQVGTDKDWLTVATCSSDTWSNVLSAAVKKDGTLWAWGFAPNFFPDLDWNSYGWGGQMTPRRVGPQDARWTAVAVAEYSVLGTRPDGTLFEIGDDWSSAKAVSPSIISTAAGGYSFGAVGADGVLWMWGWNNFGQIGNYTPRDLSNPWQDWRMTYAPEPVQAGVNADWGLPSPVRGIPVPLSFDPMPADGLGAYNLTVTRGASTATSVASFYSWSQSGQPSVVAVSGGSLRLQGGINAGGSTVSYQWYKNGVAVPGGTSPELAISAVPGNAGSYWVQAVSGKAAIRGRVTAAVVDSANVKEARKELNARNFSTASAQLNLALAANPEDGAALFLRSALDLYNLWSDPGVATNLAALGFTGSADPLNSTLRWSADGFPKGALSAPVRAWLVGTLYPKIAAAEANLAKVTDTGFLTSFGPYELGLQGEGAVVDYGDVQVLRAFLNVVLAAVKWLEAQNTDVDLAVLQLDGKNGRLSIESLLAKYPLLLTASTTGPAAQAEFVSRFKQALERYKVFSDFANPAGTPALGQRQDQSIGIARLETVENRDAEREFRNAVNKTLESINAADAVAGRRTLQTTDGFSLTASPHAFFQHAPGWRSDLPKFSRNLYQRNSINRALLQSMFPSLSLDDVAGLEEAMIAAEPKWTEALGTRADSTPPVLEMSPVTVLSSYDGWVSLDGTVQDAAGVRRVTVAVGPDGAKQVFESDLEEIIPAADGTRRYKWRAAVPLSGMSGGSLAFSISAEDVFGGVLDSPLVKVLPVAPAPVVNSALAVSGTVGTAFRYQITATNSPTSFSASGLPAGLSVNTSTGVISGTPTNVGTSAITLRATNAGGTGTASFVLNVSTLANRSLALSTNKTSMAVDLLESDPLQITVSGFLTNDNVRVGVYWDVNRNGVIEASEPLAACYNLTDGLLPKIGGVRNGNVPGDEDGVVNGSITAVLRGAALGQISAVEGDAVLKVWCEEDPSKEITKTVNVRFPTQPQRIIGTVMDLQDRPVAGAAVICSTHLNGGYMSAYCFADANGRYSIPVPPGTYRLIYGAQNYWHDPFRSQSIVDVKAGKNAYVNGVVSEYTPTRTLSGRVLTKDTNEPVRGLLLYLRNASGKVTYVCTGLDGSFSTGVEAEPLGFDIPQDALSPYGLVWALDHSDPSRPVPASFNVDLTGGNVSNLTLKLAQTADALLAGTLQGSSGPNVVSLAGTHLRSRNYLGCDWEVGTSARVLGDGRFWLATYSGSFDLNIEDDEWGVYGLISSPFYNGSTRVSLASGVGLQAVGAVTAPVGGATVRGSVTDEQGRPLKMMRYEGSQNFTVRADGSFEVRVATNWGSTYKLDVDRGYNFAPGAGNLVVPMLQSGTIWNAGTVRVSVIDPSLPRVLLRGTAETVAVGSSTVLTADAAGGGTLVYKWYVDGTRIAGQSGSSLTLVGTLNAGASVPSGRVATVGGNYVVEVSNAVGRMASQQYGVAVTNVVVPGAPVLTSGTAASGTVGTAFSYQITATNSPTSYTASGLPSGLSLNTSTGLISGSLGMAGTSTVTLGAVNAGGTGTASLVLTVRQPVPVVNSALAVSATVGTVFSYQITATNAPTSYTTSGLPAGLSLNTSTGLISGSLGIAGTSTVTLGAVNASGTGTASLVLTVRPAVPVVNSALAVSATVGTVFSYQITATNAPTSYTASGLPSGLSLNTSTGLISGSLGMAGTSTVTLGAVNAGGTGTASLVLTVRQPVPVVNSALAVSGTLGTVFSYQITATNSPTLFSASGLPAGLSVNASTGVISGTPTTAGQSAVTLGATNSIGTGSATLTLLVAQARPAITSGTLAGGVVGSAFSYQITATNNPTSYTASGLPSGLSLDTSTGLISGTPVAVGTSAITIGAANSGGVSTAIVTLEIATGSPPVLRLQPFEVKVAEWAPAVFTVVATGGGTLRYQWRKNGVPIADATEATYRIEEALKTDEALSGAGYDVVVTGDAGSVTSTRVGLTVVEGGAYVRENPVGSTVKLGAFYSLRVLVDDPDATFQWRKNGVPISGGAERMLILPSFRATDVGRYDVAIKNSDGKEVISAPAYVGTSPKVALNLQEITYQWEILAGANGGPEGNGEGSSADGTGRAASFNWPSSIALDGLGNLYVADTENHVIRRVTRSGVVSTVAGLAGVEGSANGSARSTARFSWPAGVAVDKSGGVYVADHGNYAIRKLTNPGQPTAAVTTVAGLPGEPREPGEPPYGNGPIRVEVDPNSAAYFMDQTSIRKVGSGGQFTLLHGSLDYTEIGPTAMTLDRTGTLYAALSDGNIYSRNTNYGPYPSIRDLAFGAGNNLFAAMGEGVYLLGDLSQSFPPAGVPVSLNAYLYLDGDYSQFSPSGLTVDEDGSVYAVIDYLHAVVKGTPTGLPAFLLHPAGATGVHGVPLTLSAVALGAGTVSYQWYRDGVAIPGATAATHTMAPGNSRAGVYTVEASNAAGTVTSESATVVDTQLAILSEPLAASVVEGTPVALQVGWRGPSNTTFQWYRNNVAVAGGTSPSLNFSAVKSADQGDYRVALQAGTVSLTSATVRLTVNTPVSITSQPEKRDVVPFGKPFSLSVSATGTAPLTYRWFKNGVPLNGATASTYSVGAATDSDTGSYRVEVANVVGVISSETATVTVSTRGISVLKNPYPDRPTSIIRGTAATLKLSVDANPPDALRTSYKLVRSSGAETGISGIVPASGQMEVPLRSLTAGGSYSVVFSREYVDGEVISGVTTSAFVVELRTLEEAAGTYELLLSDSNGAVGDNATYRGLLIATVSKTGAVSGRVLYNEAAPLAEASGTERAYVAVVRSFSSSFTPSAEDPAKLVCTPKLGVGTQANRQGLALELDFSAATVELSAVVRDRVSVPSDVDEEGCVSQGFGAVRGLTKLSVVPVESGTADFGSLEGRYVIGSDFSIEDESGPGVGNNATLLAQVLKTGKVLWASRLSGSTGSGSATLSTTAADSAVAQIYQGRTSSTSKILSTTSLLGQLRFQVVSGGTAWSAGVLTANGDDKLERQSCYVSKSGGTPIFDDGFYLDNVETPAFRWSGVQVLDFQNGTSCRWPGSAAKDLTAFFNSGSGEPAVGIPPLYLTAKDPVGEETYVWTVTLSPTGTVRVANYTSSSPQPTLTFRFDKTRGEWTGSFVSPGTKLRCNLYGVVARPLDDSLRGAGWVETGALPSTRTGGWRLELLSP